MSEPAQSSQSPSRHGWLSCVSSRRPSRGSAERRDEGSAKRGFLRTESLRWALFAVALAAILAVYVQRRALAGSAHTSAGGHASPPDGDA